MYNKEQILFRFYSKIKKNKQTGCWEWQGTRDIRGYGRIVVNYTRLFAHRLSWEIHNNEKLTDKKVLVCHKCDNPCCVNPEHLFKGSHKDNIQDCIKKGRRNENNSASNFNCRLNLQVKFGEDNGNSVLTWEKVKNIRTEFNAGAKQDKLAAKYNVSRFTIWEIVRNKRWIKRQEES